MKILYFSNILTIHDCRMLKKIADKFDAYLVTFKYAQIPEDIKGIKNLTIYHFPVKDFLFLSGDSLLIKIKKILENQIDFLRKISYFKKILKKINPDIVHAGWVQDTGYITTFSGFHPFVLMPWGSDILIRPRLNKRQMWITKYTLLKADMIACDCGTVKEKIVELSGYDKNKIIIFPLGVDLSLFNPANFKDELLKKLNWEDKKVVIITRTFEKIYGLNYMIEAIPQIIEKIPDARFIFCGDGKEKQNIEKMIEMLGISNYVHLAGVIEHNSLPVYLNSGDLYVTPSLSDGTSVSLLEAFACGLPVVVTDIPANLELVKDGENGLIAAVKNPNSLTEKIVTLLENDELRQMMGERNRAIVEENFNWDKNFEVIEKVYRELVLK